jgi:hypothetical protein
MDICDWTLLKFLDHHNYYGHSHCLTFIENYKCSHSIRPIDMFLHHIIGGLQSYCTKLYILNFNSSVVHMDRYNISLAIITIDSMNLNNNRHYVIGLGNFNYHLYDLNHLSNFTMDPHLCFLLL